MKLLCSKLLMMLLLMLSPMGFCQSAKLYQGYLPQHYTYNGEVFTIKPIICTGHTCDDNLAHAPMQTSCKDHITFVNVSMPQPIRINLTHEILHVVATYSGNADKRVINPGSGCRDDKSISLHAAIYLNEYIQQVIADPKNKELRDWWMQPDNSSFDDWK